MTNNLFLICPTSHLEGYLTQQYGQNSFFYTALGASFHFDGETAIELAGFMYRKNITNVILVKDLSSIFLKDAINGKQNVRIRANQELIERFNDIEVLLRYEALDDQKKEHIAEQHIKYQLMKIKTNLYLGESIKQLKIKLFGLITDKQIGRTTEFHFTLEPQLQ